ncbi:MAG: UDP-N-acetylglucosamine 2-epimerase, partial [Bdellovibrionales bacterium]|nr:UDP-N-acetylglucosamine 2-epimerase [Bdellovibrionales bacterium]
MPKSLISSHNMGMSFAFVMGTTGELIKMFPLLIESDRREIDWKVWHTGQSGVAFLNQWRDFQLPEERLLRGISSSSDLAENSKALAWFVKAICAPLKDLSKSTGETSQIWVHGDTLSTLVGAAWAFRLKCPLIHVEAGLRSGSLVQPFPEEMIRRLVSTRAHLHCPPNDVSFELLAKKYPSSQLVHSGVNTLREALDLVFSQNPSQLPEEKFVVANLHRFENLSHSYRWQKIIETVQRVAVKFPVYWFLHPSTQKKLREEAPEAIVNNPRVHLRERLPFT